VFLCVRVEGLGLTPNLRLTLGDILQIRVNLISPSDTLPESRRERHFHSMYIDIILIGVVL